jgi:hypothetical protein
VRGGSDGAGGGAGEGRSEPGEAVAEVRGSMPFWRAKGASSACSGHAHEVFDDLPGRLQ